MELALDVHKRWDKVCPSSFLSILILPTRCLLGAGEPVVHLVDFAHELLHQLLLDLVASQDVRLGLW